MEEEEAASSRVKGVKMWEFLESADGGMVIENYLYLLICFEEEGGREAQRFFRKLFSFWRQMLGPLRPCSDAVLTSILRDPVTFTPDRITLPRFTVCANIHDRHLFL